MSRVERIQGEVKNLSNDELRAFRGDELPAEIRILADRAFEQLKADPHHPSLHFKRVITFWSARVGLHGNPCGIRPLGAMTSYRR